ncbi:MAG: ornithine carbamoyltransferase, partial [Leptolyngbya sp. SIO3F4]|nr:ornithine carbamoyltransferase [Leptolyngbya sp. SIO3F4]
MDLLKGRDLLSMADLSSTELYGLLDLAMRLKARTIQPKCPNKVLGLVFSKASTRTRVSFSVAMYQLGGQVLDLNAGVTQVGRGEPTSDTARVLDRYLDVVAIRTFAQAEIEEFAQYASIPVINALTDLEHPCQILADLLTLEEAFGTLENLTMSYLGDGNNVAHSLMLGCALAGVNIRVATPEGFSPNSTVVAQAIELSQGKSEVTVTNDPNEVVHGSHALYTDVWASMGDESEAASRIPKFKPYQINQTMLDMA